MRRPAGISALAVFFAAGWAISLSAAVSLLSPGGWLEPIWKLNPRGREAFTAMGGWAVALLLAVCVACAAAAVGLWRRSRWGHRVAVGLIALNLAGDVANAVLGVERRAAVGVPIAGALLAYLLNRRTRSFFAPVAAAGDPEAAGSRKGMAPGPKGRRATR